MTYMYKQIVMLHFSCFRYDWLACEGKYNCVQSLRETNLPDCGTQVYLQVNYKCVPGNYRAMILITNNGHLKMAPSIEKLNCASKVT